MLIDLLHTLFTIKLKKNQSLINKTEKEGMKIKYKNK